MENKRKCVSSEVNADYVAKLSRMVNCKTVWTHDGRYTAEFQRFYAALDELFPNLTAKAKKLTFGEGCFFYVIEGRNAVKNILLMSHHDVVEGSKQWQTDPFQAVEELLAEGYAFEGINLYIGSSNNEEVCGDGMVLAAEYFKQAGIRFYAVIDEGGAITEGQIPGVTCKSAVVAVHEKSRHLFRCKAEIDTCTTTRHTNLWLYLRKQAFV